MNSRNFLSTILQHKLVAIGAIALLTGGTASALIAAGTPQTQTTSTCPMHSNMMTGQTADRQFIEMMIPHHEGAIAMADIALQRSQNPLVRKLAEAIKQSQSQEIAQMRSWYKQWYGVDVPVAQAQNQVHSMHGMGTMHHDSMMTGDLKTLKTTSNFEREFITQMIPHHKMALMMSVAIVDSDRLELRNLSQNITQAQSAEINQMQQWLKDKTI